MQLLCAAACEQRLVEASRGFGTELSEEFIWHIVRGSALLNGVDRQVEAKIHTIHRQAARVIICFVQQLDLLIQCVRPVDFSLVL